MKRKTINLEKFLELYEPFMEIGGWCKEKHERKHDLYDYFRKIESISIESRKGLAELIYGNHSFTVFRVPRLQRGKLFSLRGKWILMCGYGASRGGRYLKVFRLRSKPHAQLFERMAKLRDYCQQEEYYEEMEDYYKELKVERLRKKEPVRSRIYILALISQYSPIKATCKECNLETTFSGYWSYRTKTRRHHVDQYQCQSCGKLSYSEEDQKGIPVACIEACKCGGQLRRDKNIFCPGCGYRKRKNNKAETFTTISQAELDILETKHESILEDD